MPVETRSRRRSTRIAARLSTPTPAPPPRPPRQRPNPEPTPLTTLTSALRSALAHTTSLRRTLADLTTRLASAEHNLSVTKHHLRAATTEVRESKRIICRYLELSMADIPPCKSLQLPMDVYADESCGRLAAVVREQEDQVRAMRRAVEGVGRQVREGAREVGRLRRRVRGEKEKMGKMEEGGRGGGRARGVRKLEGLGE